MYFNRFAMWRGGISWITEPRNQITRFCRFGGIIANDEDSRAFSAVSACTLTTSRPALAVVTNEALFGTYAQHVRSSMDMYVRTSVRVATYHANQMHACLPGVRACVRAFNVRYGSACLM
jgi:hypothetical protein